MSSMSIIFEHAIQRAAFCYALCRINQDHIDLWCEHNQQTFAPFSQLSRKVESYLRGELKSLPNLERFHEAFALWRDELIQDDTLAYQIAELTCSALYCAAESILDPECDDIELLQNNVAEIYRDMESLTDNVPQLREYFTDICQGLQQQLDDSSRPPLAGDFFRFIDQCDASLFGL